MSDAPAYTVALAGNPNTGKSTVFNALTGLRQHTGNWPGKTVTKTEGVYRFKGEEYTLVDLPGTYSLLSHSTDEEIARDYILFSRPDVTVVVTDATCLERNLNLVLQVLEITDQVVVCLNLMDEAERKGILIDHERLEEELGVPVVPTAARKKTGLPVLMKTIQQVAAGRLIPNPRKIPLTHPALERALDRLIPQIKALYPQLDNPRWVALRLIEGDQGVREAFGQGRIGPPPVPGKESLKREAI